MDTIGEGRYYAQGVTANMPSNIPATKTGATTWMIKVIIGRGSMSSQYAHSLDMGLFYRARYSSSAWTNWYRVSAETVNQ